jgi:hypothetical protein
MELSLAGRTQLNHGGPNPLAGAWRLAGRDMKALDEVNEDRRYNRDPTNIT